MAILYGTQSNGETLPVLVDQFGNLLAKGIDGQQGPPGPPGAPGVGQLPPDPYEGAILGWKDNELAWLGGFVPLPAGTYGPFTYIPGNEQLDIPQDASGLVNGQQIYMSDNAGNPVDQLFTTDTITTVTPGPLDNQYVLFFPTSNNFDKFAVGEVVQESFTDGAVTTGNGGVWTNKDNMFDSDTTNFAHANYNGSAVTVTQTFNPPLACSTSIKVFAGLTDSGTDATVSINGGATTPLSQAAGNLPVYTEFTEIPFSGLIETIVINKSTSGNGLYVFGYEVDGSRLYDSDRPRSSIAVINEAGKTITVDGGIWSAAGGSSAAAGRSGATYLSTTWSGSGSVFQAFDGVILLRENNKEWVDGFYVTAPEQRIAARKVATAAIKKNTKRDQLR
jgi:hypothetical protein